MPAPREGEPDRKLHRLLIAQDTGGAIRGPVRGDLFWGFGPEAEAVAGRMKHRGKMWVLLPRGVGRGSRLLLIHPRPLAHVRVLAASIAAPLSP